MGFLLLATAALSLALLHAGRGALAWILPGAFLLAGWGWIAAPPPWLLVPATLLSFAAAAVGGFPPLRRIVLTRHLLPRIRPFLPQLGETERIAVEAGTVGWEGELATGRPRWRRLLAFRPRELTAREEAFLAGPCETVSGMLTDREVSREGDLPPAVWEYLAREGFFGLIVPVEHGGLGFSAAAHSAVVQKLASRSVALAVTVMLPNALGPAELILHHGTQAQREEYLPRLASGAEIPAFALTEPGAGSDAGSMQSTGVVCEGVFRGQRVLGLRLNWDKRYITLAPVATVLALAFKMRDPDHLLGAADELGITCALVPTNLPGVEQGARHDPLGVAFLNGPTRGTDVFVPLDFIIGGRAQAGQGWRMLMQTLAAGRGVSLPSMAVGGAKLALRAAGAHATVRQQFGVSIGRFEGIVEPLARIGGLTYAMDATRRLTVGAVDAGERPSVATAMTKRYLTEAMRIVVNDAMDVLGGAGISLGPRNVLGGAYLALPIAVTVEGANILTRSMIVFGQGSLRCHPFVQDELKGAATDDLALFDRAFFGHVGFVAQNMVRSLVLGLTNGALARAPVPGPAGRLYGRLTRLSATYALVADFAMGTLGSSLKQREALTGRFADVHAWLYIASAALKRFHDEGSPARDLSYVRWVVDHATHAGEEALRGVLRNFPHRWVAQMLAVLAFPLGARTAPPADRLAGEVARGLLDGGEPRLHLSEGIYVPPASEPGLGWLEEALARAVAAQPVHQKLAQAAREKRLARLPKETLADRALAAGIIDAAERALVAAADAARAKVVAVDEFPPRSRALAETA
ncbi:MAG: acyl-CoA dehydrogenase [Planctomycetota bacterium]